MSDKRPESVLVVVHAGTTEFLLLKRTLPSGFWQSVTGSLERGETPLEAARREIAEEIGVTAAARDFTDWQLRNRYPIPPAWRSRYEPGVSHNIEHVFSLEIERGASVRLSPEEHLEARWLDAPQALAATWSWTNRDAIRLVLGPPDSAH